MIRRFLTLLVTVSMFMACTETDIHQGGSSGVTPEEPQEESEEEPEEEPKDERTDAQILAIESLQQAFEATDLITSITPTQEGSEVTAYNIMFLQSEPILLHMGVEGYIADVTISEEDVNIEINSEQYAFDRFILLYRVNGIDVEGNVEITSIDSAIEILNLPEGYNFIVEVTGDDATTGSSDGEAVDWEVKIIASEGNNPLVSIVPTLITGYGVISKGGSLSISATNGNSNNDILATSSFTYTASDITEYSETHYPRYSGYWYVKGLTSDTELAILNNQLKELEKAVRAAAVTEVDLKIALNLLNVYIFDDNGESLPAGDTWFSFSGCNNLISFTAESLASGLPEGAFSGCKNLETVTLPKLTDMIENIFIDCISLRSISAPKIVHVGGSAFGGCTSLSAVSFPVAGDIFSQAFSGCSNLSSVEMPGALIIWEYAFYNCDKLTTVKMESAKNIKKFAFSSCSELKSLSLPKAAYIGDRVLQHCSNLTDLYIGYDDVTGEKSTIISIHKGWMTNSDTEMITLRLGDLAEGSGVTVVDNTMTIEDQIYIFKEIIR